MKSVAAAVVGLAIAGVGTFAAGPIVGQSFGNMAAAAQGMPASGSVATAQNARVTDAFGTVERKVGGDASLSWKTVSVGDLLAPQTTLRTGDNSALLLELPRGHLLRISSKTTVLLRQIGQDNQYSFKVFGGQVWSMVRKANHPTKFEVETPSAVAGVTGTIFSVAADTGTGQTVVSTDEGSVVVRQPDGQKAAVTGGNFVDVAPQIRGLLARGFVARPQSAEMRQMWNMLRSEGVLVRHPNRMADGRFAPFRMQRTIQPQLYRGFLNYRHGRFAPSPFSGRPFPRHEDRFHSMPQRRQDSLSPMLQNPQTGRPDRLQERGGGHDLNRRPAP